MRKYEKIKENFLNPSREKLRVKALLAPAQFFLRCRVQKVARNECLSPQILIKTLKVDLQFGSQKDLLQVYLLELSSINGHVN